MRRRITILTVFAACLLFAPAMLSPAQALATDPGIVGFWNWYAVQDVVVSGDYAYAAADDFRVIDVSDPAAPELAGYCPNVVPGWANGVDVAGDFAYVVTNAATWEYDPGTLEVIDIGDPAAPVVVGTCGLPSSPYGVTVAGDLAYIVTWLDVQGSLQVVDISDPAAPVVLGSCALQYGAFGVAAAGSLVYVPTNGSPADLDVIDAGDPSVPSVSGSCTMSMAAYDIAVAGGFAYVAASDFYGETPGTLQVIDVTDPATPVVTGSCALPNGGVGVAVVDGSAYVATRHAYSADPGTLQVVDISDPAAPAVTTSCALPCGGESVAVAGKYGYVGCYDGLRVVDLDPAQLASLTPDHGKTGATVTIAGAKLGTSGTVRFGDTEAAASAWSETAISCTVPVGLSTGVTTVTVTPSDGSTSNALAFTVEGAQLSSLTPDHAPTGATVVIAGADLGESGTVRFGSSEAATSSWGDTAITCTVPVGLAAGATSVTVTPTGGATSNALPFTVDSVAAGVLDPSFGSGGKVVTDLTSGSDWASGATIQADGKIVVAGGAASGKRFAIARYNSDGTLDASFSGDGRAFVDFTSGYDSATNVAVQSDGRIVVVGAAGWGARVNTKFALARLNSDGTLDKAFSGDGKVTTDFTAREDFVNGVVIEPDGKIVVAGPSGVYGSSPKVALARYNGDGTLDRTFSGDGKVRTDFTPGTDDWANGMALQADGKVVVAGVAGVGANWKFALVRYDSDGSLDTSFSGDGKVTTDITTTQDQAVGVAIQADGRIVAAGIAAQRRTNSKFALVRYNSDGSLDTSFSGDGKVTTDLTTRKDEAYGVAIQADGRIVAGGEAGRDGANPTFALVRYNNDGSLDTSFGKGGKVRTDFTPKEDFANALLIQSDGRIVAAGESGYGGSRDGIALARYQ